MLILLLTGWSVGLVTLVFQVEEIDDIDANSSDPFVADAIANEREMVLSEVQKGNFKKVLCCSYQCNLNKK